MILKKGWEEGKGPGIGAKGRAEPFVPPHQKGEDAHLGLGCLRDKDLLTGKAAEHEIKVYTSAATDMSHVSTVCL